MSLPERQDNLRKRTVIGRFLESGVKSVGLGSALLEDWQLAIDEFNAMMDQQRDTYLRLIRSLENELERHRRIIEMLRDSKAE